MRLTVRLVLSLAAASPAAAAAQEVDSEKPLLPRITPDCRKPDPNEIVVCGDRGERSPYRLPPPPPPVFDWRSATPGVSRERNALFDVGETGIGSCSNVGPGGPFGCTFKQWKHREQQRRSRKYD